MAVLVLGAVLVPRLSRDPAIAGPYEAGLRDGKAYFEEGAPIRQCRLTGAEHPDWIRGCREGWKAASGEGGSSAAGGCDGEQGRYGCLDYAWCRSGQADTLGFLPRSLDFGGPPVGSVLSTYQSWLAGSARSAALEATLAVFDRSLEEGEAAGLGLARRLAADLCSDDEFLAQMSERQLEFEATDAFPDADLAWSGSSFSGCAAAPAEACGFHTLTVKIEDQEPDERSSVGCLDSDLGSGNLITVRDGSGSLLAWATLLDAGEDLLGYSCLWIVELHVPEASSYEVEVWETPQGWINLSLNPDALTDPGSIRFTCPVGSEDGCLPGYVRRLTPDDLRATGWWVEICRTRCVDLSSE